MGIMRREEQRKEKKVEKEEYEDTSRKDSERI
jgi:hypothetical protein